MSLIEGSAISERRLGGRFLAVLKSRADSKLLLGKRVNFGAICEGADLNDLNEADFRTIEKALYEHKVSGKPSRTRLRFIMAERIPMTC